MDDAKACGAEAIVTMCPICHLNLDSRQVVMGYSEVEEIPVFQATRLMSLEFGQGEDKAAIKYNLTDPKPYLREKAKGSRWLYRVGLVAQEKGLAQS
jgi:heterodisulfide reductase subunit B